MVSRQEKVSFQVDGMVSRVYVVLGDPVKTGDLLAELNMYSAQSELASASSEIAQLRDKLNYEGGQLALELQKADLELAAMAEGTEKDLARVERDKLQAELDYLRDSANRRISALEDRIGELNTQLASRFIYAPCDGKVSAVNSGYGIVSAGTAVVTIAVDGEYEIRYDEDSTLGRNTFRSEGIINGVTYDLTQKELTQAEYLSYTYSHQTIPATFYLPEGAQVEVGDFVMLRVYSKEMDDVLYVPLNAFYRSAAMNGYVYRIVDGEKVYTDVSCLFTTDAWAVITGVEEGDVVYVKQ